MYCCRFYFVSFVHLLWISVSEPAAFISIVNHNHLRNNISGQGCDSRKGYKGRNSFLGITSVRNLLIMKMANATLAEHDTGEVYQKLDQHDQFHTYSRNNDDLRTEKSNVESMPWTASIGSHTYRNESECDYLGRQSNSIRDSKNCIEESLLFMPYWEWQLSFMESKLSNLRSVPCTEFEYRENTEQKARIVNACYTSDEYRKIRMTYYDAGDKTQVFNSLWYPDPKLGNVPLLGIDLLAFNREKYLVVVDFQPLPPEIFSDDSSSFSTERTKYERMVQRTWERLPSILRGQMSKRFYDENQFFSKAMLFGRFGNDKEYILHDELWTAYQQYVDIHVNMVKMLEEEGNSRSDLKNVDNRGFIDPSQTFHEERDKEKMVLEGQKQYDIYSADRDPAHALFSKMFGKRWADSYVYEFLFDLGTNKARECHN